MTPFVTPPEPTPKRLRPSPALPATPKLADYPFELVRLACHGCERAGQYPKAVLVARYGPDALLPDLRHQLAQCPRRGSYSAACGVYYPDLSPNPLPGGVRAL